MTEIVGRLNISLFCQWRYLKIRRQKKIIKICGVIFFILIFSFFKDKSCNLPKIVSVRISASVKRFFGSRMRIFFFQSHFMDQSSHFHKSETTIAKQFFLNITFSFLILVQYYLDTCVNWVAKFVTQKCTPLRSEF